MERWGDFGVGRPYSLIVDSLKWRSVISVSDADRPLWMI